MKTNYSFIATIFNTHIKQCILIMLLSISTITILAGCGNNVESVPDSSLDQPKTSEPPPRLRYRKIRPNSPSTQETPDSSTQETPTDESHSSESENSEEN